MITSGIATRTLAAGGGPDRLVQGECLVVAAPDFGARSTDQTGGSGDGGNG